MEDQNNLHKVPISENLVERLLRNIKRRTIADKQKANGGTSHVKPTISVGASPTMKVGASPIITERDFANEEHTDIISTKVSARSSFGYKNYKKGRFLDYHRHVAETRDERMLKVYD